jgi:hypothetical protein
MFPRLKVVPKTGLEVSAGFMGNFLLSLTVYLLCERTALQNGHKFVAYLVNAAWSFGILHTLVIVCVSFLALNRAADRDRRGDLSAGRILKAVSHCFGQTFLSLALTCIALSALMIHIQPYPMPWGLFGIDGVIFYAVLVSIIPIACTSYLLAREKRLEF